MNQIIKDFLKDPKSFYFDEGFGKIVDNKSLIQKALENKKFLKIVFSPYCTTLSDYRSDIIFPILLKSPDSFLSLAPECLLYSLSFIDTEMWDKLPLKTRKILIPRILPTIKLAKSQRCRPFQIVFPDDSFLESIEYLVAAQIIVHLVPYFPLTLPGKFLAILKALSFKSFARVLSHCTISFGLEDNKYFDMLPEEYRQAVLKAIVDNRAEHPIYIAEAKHVTREFLDQNTTMLCKTLDDSDRWIIESILETKRIKFSAGHSKFASKAARKWGFSDYLSKEDLKKHVQTLKTTGKTAWANLLKNKNIVHSPSSLLHALRGYCSLKNPPEPTHKIKISDEIISELTPKQLVNLVQKTISEKGNASKLQYDPALVARQLTPLILTQPDYYQKEIADKLTLGIEKYKNGKTIYEGICQYLGIESNDRDAQENLKFEEGVLEKAIRRAISSPSETQRYLYVSFIIDMLEGQSFLGVQAKYRDLVKLQQKENGTE